MSDFLQAIHVLLDWNVLRLLGFPIPVIAVIMLTLFIGVPIILIRVERFNKEPIPWLSFFTITYGMTSLLFYSYFMCWTYPWFMLGVFTFAYRLVKPPKPNPKTPPTLGQLIAAYLAMFLLGLGMNVGPFFALSLFS